jgi:formylglycine-generating enzyme required for sulfatase activity
MARIEKTVFISYRRTDVYTALAVYQDLKNQGYDIFFDYRSISSGAFEQIILSNIKARAHFLLILTSTALDRCNEPGDWLRREIKTAIDERRNIIPLLFKGFQFGAPSVSDKLTGKLKDLSGYNGLNVHEDYFDEAMYRLRTQYLNVPLDTVLHPVSTLVRNAVREEQVAVDEALKRDEEVKELVKQVKESPNKPKQKSIFTRNDSTPSIKNITDEKRVTSSINPRLIGGIVGGVIALVLLIWGGLRLFNNTLTAAPESTLTLQAIVAVSTSQPLALQDKSAPTQTLTLNAAVTPSPTQTLSPATPTLGVGSILISDEDNMTLVYVPAGNFTMGIDNGAVDERPSHQAFLDAFWIDQTEVTNKMYTSCVNAGACNQPTNVRSYTHNLYYGNTAFDNYPVIYVDWNMANAYCVWARRRLPSEAEWEKAARGDDGRIFPWGNNDPNGNLLNYNNNVQDTSRVKSYDAGRSPYGAYDMLGNVWEWVNDWYGETYYQTSPPSNPLGPDLGIYRVHRGGSWYDDITYIRSSKRDKGYPSFAYYNLGFRCALSTTP